MFVIIILFNKLWDKTNGKSCKLASYFISLNLSFSIYKNGDKYTVSISGSLWGLNEINSRKLHQDKRVAIILSLVSSALCLKNFDDVLCFFRYCCGLGAKSLKSLRTLRDSSTKPCTQSEPSSTVTDTLWGSWTWPSKRWEWSVSL